MLVEDNPAEARLLFEVISELPTYSEFAMLTFSDGNMALNHLRETKGKNDQPDLVILDINIPGINGLDLLKIIKNDKTLMTLPVIILTNSSNENDISKAYENFANCYIKKPLELEEFSEVIRSLQNFWLKTATLPKVC
jgi:DNA-binding response OmpR family regulator